MTFPVVHEDFTFDRGGSTPGRKHKFRPGDGCWWTAFDSEGVPYRQYGYVVGWEMKSGSRGYYHVIRLTAGHFGARPYGRPVWIVSYNLTPTGKWWKGLMMQFRANRKLAERGCSCQCCVHEAIPRSVLKLDGTLKGDDDAEPVRR